MATADAPMDQSREAHHPASDVHQLRVPCQHRQQAGSNLRPVRPVWARANRDGSWVRRRVASAPELMYFTIRHYV
jgi:hypothetical protein